MSPSRKRPILFLFGLFTLCATLLSACGSPSGDALAHQACLDVQRSVSLYHQSTNTQNAASKAALVAKAESALRDALQPASLAGAGGGPWEALAMTLSESNRVSEATLITALNAQCAASLATN